MDYVFFNDRIVPADQAAVSIHDTGLLHGVGLFETLRSYGGRVFRLEDHLDRLFGSAKSLGIDITQGRNDIIAGVYSLLKAKELEAARIRLTVTRGSLQDVSEDQPPRSTLFVTAVPLRAYPEELYRFGMMITLSSYRQNPHEPTAGHKTLNYFGRLIALQQAHNQGAGESLWFSPGNHLAEGCISNIFLVKDGTVLTPPLDTPVLAGITRKLVLVLAQTNNIAAQEKPLVVKDLLNADEVFLTNSLMELMPVTHIEKHKINGEEPGPVYRKLHEFYRQLVKEETGSTINSKVKPG